MSDLQVAPSSSRIPLPPPPATHAMSEAIRARLAAIRGTVLPDVQRYRAVLELVWYSNEPDAVLVYVGDSVAIPCAPAGFDRLASVVAEEQMLVREGEALASLESAIDSFESGGCATMADCRDDSDGRMPLPPVQLVPPPVPSVNREGRVGREQARLLRAYEASLRREIETARATGNGSQAEILERELNDLVERTRQYGVGRGELRRRHLVARAPRRVEDGLAAKSA